MGGRIMEVKGIDVSKWQGTIDWQKVKNAGIQFAIIREGYGKKTQLKLIKNSKKIIKAQKMLVLE